MASAAQKSQMLKKVGECLYRNGNKVCFALLKVRGKQIKRSLQISDLALAKRRLPDLQGEGGAPARRWNRNIRFEELATQRLESIKSSLKPNSFSLRHIAIVGLGRSLNGMPVRAIGFTEINKLEARARCYLVGDAGDLVQRHGCASLMGWAARLTLMSSGRSGVTVTWVSKWMGSITGLSQPSVVAGWWHAPSSNIARIASSGVVMLVIWLFLSAAANISVKTCGLFAPGCVGGLRRRWALQGAALRRALEDDGATVVVVARNNCRTMFFAAAIAGSSWSDVSSSSSVMGSSRFGS